MLPLLEILKDGRMYHMSELVTLISDHFGLTVDEREVLLPSGQQAIINNRVGWARSYLKKAEILHDPKRSYTQITEKGKSILANNPEHIDTKFLMIHSESFRKWREKQSEESPSQPIIVDDTAEQATPEELLSHGFIKIKRNLTDMLMEHILASSPDFFEKLVIDLLLKVGYGGSEKEARVTQRSKDGGIDGIIKEDKLGLSNIYIQAKRWENVVGRPEIQKFAGALLSKETSKGVFITTSSFSKEALDYANMPNVHIVLIDGQRLVDLMFEYNLGVSTKEVYEIKRLDSDYFELE
ncbi:restriction endonuclease [Entomospira entomophila]|nr:restriction endonuclease [Entomospira entomophilus]